MTDIEWPRDWDRTDPADRAGDYKFDVSLARAFNDLEQTLDRIGVAETDYRYSFEPPARKQDDRPYADARVDDPGFVLRWSMDTDRGSGDGGEQYAVACDHYDGLRGNVRAVGLYLEEKRRMEGRPIKTGQSEFATARLPPGDGDRDAVVSEPPAHEVLNIAPDAPETVVRAAARQLKAKHHPDSGDDPDREQFRRVVSAEENLLG